MLHHFLETHGRSILKALTWKCIATLLTFLIMYRETGNFSQAAQFSGMIFVLGLILYYLHERIWNSIHWGKEHIEHKP